MKIYGIDRRRLKRNIVVFYRETGKSSFNSYIDPRKKIKFKIYPVKDVNFCSEPYVEIYCGNNLIALYDIYYRSIIRAEFYG